MVRLDALWRHELAPPTTETDVLAELGARASGRTQLGAARGSTSWSSRTSRRWRAASSVRSPSITTCGWRRRNGTRSAQLRERAPHVLLCDHRLEWQKTDDLFEHVRDNYPRVRRVLYSFSHLEVWNDLLQRKLVDAVVPKSAPRNALLAALF